MGDVLATERALGRVLTHPHVILVRYKEPLPAAASRDLNDIARLYFAQTDEVVIHLEADAAHHYAIAHAMFDHGYDCEAPDFAIHSPPVT